MRKDKSPFSSVVIPASPKSEEYLLRMFEDLVPGSPSLGTDLKRASIPADFSKFWITTSSS